MSPINDVNLFSSESGSNNEPMEEQAPSVSDSNQTKLQKSESNETEEQSFDKQKYDLPTQNESTNKKLNPIEITKLKMDEQNMSNLNTTREPELTARAQNSHNEIDNSVT